jgi:hypothetical protein
VNHATAGRHSAYRAGTAPAGRELDAVSGISLVGTGLTWILTSPVELGASAVGHRRFRFNHLLWADSTGANQSAYVRHVVVSERRRQPGGAPGTYSTAASRPRGCG